MTDTLMEPTAVQATGRVTLAQGTALYVGAVLGTGVIALPALAAQVAGPASLLAWFALVLISVPVAGTFAALAARYPDAGGVSTFAARAFGPRAAAVSGWWFYLAVPFGEVAAAMFGGVYVADATGGGRPVVLASAAVMIAATAASNYFGLKVSGRVAFALAALLALLLLLAAGTSLPHAHLGNLHPFAPHGWGAVGTAAALLVWSFAGWEAVTYLAADFRAPRRDLPRATGAAVAVVGLLYLSVAVASILVLGPAGGTSGAPLADLLAVGLGGGPTRTIAAVIAVLLTLGTMNAYVAGAAKLGSALGRDGALPAWLAHGSSAGQIPRRSLAPLTAMALVVLAAVAATGTGTHPLVLLTTGAFVAVYVLGAAAAIRLLPRRSAGRSGALIALAFSLVLLAFTGWYAAWPLVLAAGCLAYLRARRTPGNRPAAGQAPIGR